MAGVSKANQRQSQKRKSSKRYGLKKVRMKVIPMVCPRCHQTYDLPSQTVYQLHGTPCKRCAVYDSIAHRMDSVNLVMAVDKFTHKVTK